MDNEALRRRLITIFTEEFGEHIEVLDKALLAVEQKPFNETKKERETLFRTAHSLKGAARAVGMEQLEQAAHHLESIFSLYSSSEEPNQVPRPMLELLFRAVDALRDSHGRLRSGGSLEGGLLGALMGELESAATEGFVPIKKSVPAPAPSDPLPQTYINRGESDFVRVASEKLDHLVDLGGELLVARRRLALRQSEVEKLLAWAKEWQRDTGRSEAKRKVDEDRLGEIVRQLKELSNSFYADSRALEQAAAPLEAEITRARMIRFSDACEGLHRAARDLARAADKEVELIISGGEIELDRSIANGLRDPLLHLVRNAIAHGIEPASEREARGKPAKGRVTIAAALCARGLEITVSDDGRGLDWEMVREQARQRGLEVPENEQELSGLIFRPGFTTTHGVTKISGRGMGLDIVKTAVESRRGEVTVRSNSGGGTRFILTLPLSLTTLPALLVKCAGRTFAFDSAAVQSLQRITAEELRRSEGRTVLPLNGKPIPVLQLAGVLGLKVHESLQPGSRAAAVVLNAGSAFAGFIVDELVSEQEIVVKSLGKRLSGVPGVLGASILASGDVALILSASDLVRQATTGNAERELPLFAERQVEARKRLLVVDDSVTTRTLVKSILEAAGYDVRAAADGAEAWRVLQEAEVDVVVSDVEMPQMSGFELTEAIRASQRLKRLPVILVTARETEEDRMRGMQAGANAYIMKSSFNQSELLDTIEQIL